MSCNSCSKSFSLFRSEKGCPSCGFSYCSKCLNHKLFSEKRNAEIMVCARCKQSAKSNEHRKVEPPDAYYKRIGEIDNATRHGDSTSNNEIDKELTERLKKLKEYKQDKTPKASNENIADRLQKLKGEVPSTSDAELRARLANIKGVPISAIESKPVLLQTFGISRTEQEQVDDLLKQYVEQGNIDKKYDDEFDGLVNNIEARLQNLKGSHTLKQTSKQEKTTTLESNYDTEDEDASIRKIIEKAKAMAKLDSNDINSGIEELPFCEICNEDAKMRCLGCKYLFCKQCFKDHIDSDYDCDKFEPYSPP